MTVTAEADLAALGAATVWKPLFPDASMVAAAAGLFAAERHPDTYRAAPSQGSLFDQNGRIGAAGLRTMVEGPRWRVEVFPGGVAVRASDPARAERAAERAHETRRAVVDALAGELERTGDMLPDRPGVARVRCWSPRSRSRMVQRLSEFDYAPLFADGLVPAMVTLTYPGDWLAVAPSAQVARGHLKRFLQQVERDWGRECAAVWKREFQRRGAPHFHILMTPPAGEVNGLPFAAWVARTWARIVGSAFCGGPELRERDARGRWVTVCCERHRHLRAGTGIDYAEGARCRDPRRLGVYFAKHGAFEAKEYQNDAPAEWLHAVGCPSRDGAGDGCEGCADEGVGRFWGYWRLRRAVSAVPVASDVAQAVVRTARRWSHANRGYAPRTVWRKSTRVVLDTTTGELVPVLRWRKRRVNKPIRRLTGGQRAGFLLVNDGPAFASRLAAVAEQLQRPRPGLRPGRLAGPAGFLP